MLPLVLGGIALAAVGYGVKEFCESEGCPWDEEPSQTPTKKQNVFEALHKRKTDVYVHSFKPLQEHFTKIKNLKNMPFDVWTQSLTEEKLACAELNSEIKLYADSYDDILRKARHILNAYSQEVETIMQASLDYKSYSKEDKKSIKKMYKFMQKMDDVFALKLLDEGANMDVDSILALREYREMFSKKYDDNQGELAVPSFLQIRQ